MKKNLKPIMKMIISIDIYKNRLERNSIFSNECVKDQKKEGR